MKVTQIRGTKSLSQKLRIQEPCELYSGHKLIILSYYYHISFFFQNLGKSKIAHEAGQHTSQDVVTWDTSQGKSLPVSETSGNYTGSMLSPLKFC